MSLIAAIRKQVDLQRLYDKRWVHMFEPDTTGEVVSVDCETTGFDLKRDDVISIAAIKIRGNRILASEAFRATVRPEAKLTGESIRVHQIRGQDLAEARIIREVLPEFLDFVGTRPLVGYWIDFDATLLNRYTIEYYGLRLPNPRIEVSRLYYDRKYGRAPKGSEIDLRFATILADLGLPAIAQHDAFEDALATAEMYLMLKSMVDRGVYFAGKRRLVHSGLAV